LFIVFLRVYNKLLLMSMASNTAASHECCVCWQWHV